MALIISKSASRRTQKSAKLSSAFEGLKVAILARAFSAEWAYKLMAVSGAENPWTSNDLLLGVKLGDPRSGVVIARRCGLLGPQVWSRCVVVSYELINTLVQAVLM